MAEQDSRLIFHVALESDWVAARSRGGYRMSTLGMTLDEVGFTHAAYEEQVSGVLERFYGDVTESLVLLVIDPGLLHVRVEEQNDPGLGEAFPHIMGPINRDAVVEVRPVQERVTHDDLRVESGTPSWTDNRALVGVMVAVLLLALVVALVLAL